MVVGSVYNDMKPSNVAVSNLQFGGLNSVCEQSYNIFLFVNQEKLCAWLINNQKI